MKLGPAILAMVTTVTAAPNAWAQKPIVDDYSEQVVHISIAAGCGSYVWPVSTTAGSVGKTKWHDIAVQELCKQYGPQTALAFDVRGDGRMIALNQTDFTDDRFFADAFRAASFVHTPVRVTIDGAGNVIVTPPGILKDIPNAAADLRSTQREIQFLAHDHGLTAADRVIDVTIGTDNTISWSGLADPNQQPNREAGAQLCLRYVWDLPFERQVMCAVRIALLAVVPAR